MPGNIVWGFSGQQCLGILFGGSQDNNAWEYCLGVLRTTMPGNVVCFVVVVFSLCLFVGGGGVTFDLSNIFHHSSPELALA